MVHYIAEGIKALLITVFASVLLIALSMVYFGITLWIIKAASNAFFGPGLEANWAVLSAAILSVGGIMAGSMERRKK